jgi:antitoxin component HigA of HigAB toxin-antitoxin module
MFMMEQTPIFKALGFVMPELTANMRESAASMAEVGDSIALSGGKAFAMGQTLRDAAVNVGTALDEIIAGMGKQGEVTEETETMVEKYKKQLQELRQALIDATKGTGDHEKELKKQSAALSKAASETAKAREEVERVATAHERLKQQIELSAGPQEVQRQNWIDMSGLTDQLTRNLETTTHQLDMYAHNTGKSEKETIDLSRAIENLDHLFSAFGINANSAMGGVLRDFSLLNESLPAIAGQTDGIFGNDSLSKMQKYQAAAGGIAQGIAGIAKATASGSTGSRAARGALAGAAAGGQFGPIGAAVGAGVGALTGFLRGRAVDKFEDTLKREMEFSVSRGLAEAVKASGEKWQLSLGAMLQEGVDTLQIGGDDVAREIGDLFSMFERGELSEGEIFESLRGAIPVLLQNLENLGEGGEAEVDRIIAAAQRMGIEFEGLSELINSTFAPQTLEEMKESLGLTGEEVRALAEKLGVDLQTNLERSAQQMGLTVDELKALQDAAGQALGSEGAASMEELQALMDAMGLSAQDLADKLGLEIPGGAGSLADEAAKGKTEISLAADEALRLKDNLISAANAANGINIPSGGPGPGSDIPAFAHGGFVPETFPSGKIVRVAEPGTGGEYMTPAKGGGGTSNVSNVTINVQVQGSDEQAAHKIGLLLERDKAGLRRRTRKALGL